MTTILRRISWLATLVFFGTFGFSALCHASVNELLYVQEGSDLITYKVNPKTAAATKLGTMPFAAKYYGIQILHAPTSPFLYVLGFTSLTKEYIWVYKTTPAGVPTGAPIQQLAVKPALSQFVILPNGAFAYAMYSWVASEQYVSDIVLFTVDPTTGKLLNTMTPIANFPPHSYTQTSIYGVAQGGTMLYTNAATSFGSTSSNSFTSYSINGKTGKLRSPTQFWTATTTPPGLAYSTINDRLIGFAQNNGMDSSNTEIDIYPNQVNPTTPLVRCTSAMASVCGDNLDAIVPLQFDPSGNYLFVTDTTVNEVAVAKIDLTAKILKETGSSIPGNPLVFFSPDGLLVYAVEGSEILVYVFNPHSGLLTARTTINAPGVGLILPWQ